MDETILFLMKSQVRVKCMEKILVGNVFAEWSLTRHEFEYSRAPIQITDIEHEKKKIVNSYFI